MWRRRQRRCVYGIHSAVQALAHYVFTHAFVDAMHPTMVLPIVVLVLAAFGASFARAHKPVAATTREEQEAAVA